MTIQDRLRSDLVMSMFLSRDDLYRQMDAERKEAANVIDDLYEALEYMMVCHRDSHDKECERAIDMTVAALAKARGESE